MPQAQVHSPVDEADYPHLEVMAERGDVAGYGTGRPVA
jgi:hypothetical protein